MTREIINKQPQNVRNAIERFKKDYKNPVTNKGEVRSRIAGYVQGLYDAGLITERERQTLFIYATV